MIPDELAKYGMSGVAVGLIIATYLTVRLLLSFMEKKDIAQNQVIDSLRTAIDANTKVTGQVFTLLRRVNGRAKKDGR